MEQRTKLPFIRSFEVYFDNYLKLPLAKQFGDIVTKDICKNFTYYAFANCSTLVEVEMLAMKISENINSLNTILVGDLIRDAFNTENAVETIMAINQTCKLFNNAYKSMESKSNLTINDIYLQKEQLNSMLFNRMELEENERNILNKTYLIEEELFLKACQNLMNKTVIR